MWFCTGAASGVQHLTHTCAWWLVHRDPAGERDDQFETIKEQVEEMIKERIGKTLEGPDKGGWLAAKVSTWTGDVVESVLKELMGRLQSVGACLYLRSYTFASWLLHDVCLTIRLKGVCLRR